MNLESCFYHLYQSNFKQKVLSPLELSGGVLLPAQGMLGKINGSGVRRTGGPLRSDNWSTQWEPVSSKRKEETSDVEEEERTQERGSGHTAQWSALSTK